MCGLKIDPILIRLHECILIEDYNQSESLLYPYQTIVHIYLLNLTPTKYLDTNRMPSNHNLSINNYKIVFLFNGRKIF